MKKKLVIMWIVLFVWAVPPLYAGQIILGIDREQGTRPYRLAAKICEAIGEEMGETISLKCLPLKRSMHLLTNGAIHGEFVRIDGLEKEYPQLIKVEEPVGEVLYNVYSQSVQFEVNGWESLKPYSIVYQRGAYYIEKNAKNHKIKNHPVDSYEQALRSIRAGRYDLFVAPAPKAGWYINSRDFKGIKKLQPLLSRVKFYTYFHKKHADLAERYLRALVELKRNGIIKKIIESDME